MTTDLTELPEMHLLQAAADYRKLCECHVWWELRQLRLILESKEEKE